MADSGQTETTDAVAQEPAAQETTQEQAASMADGYCKRQIGLIGIMLLIGGVAAIAGGVVSIVFATDERPANPNSIGQGIGMIITGLGFLYIDVEDKGDYLLVTSGPFRWCLCGWGKEKVKYSEITDFSTAKTCWYSIPEYACCTGVRLMNQCSCTQMDCCGSNMLVGGAGCCSQRTVRLTIKERNFGHEAVDGDECCLEKCCLERCFGATCSQDCFGGPCGEGCCFSCCNPCGVNCCSMNTMYISTNDPEGLIDLLKNKTNTASI